MAIVDLRYHRFPLRGAGAGGGGLVTKSGKKLSGDFTGNPKKATVTFSTPFADANYSPSVIGEDSRAWEVESVAAGSFVISSGSASGLTGDVYWTAIKHGES